VIFTPGLQVQADGKEQLQPRRLVALTLDQVDADGRLTRLERPAGWRRLCPYPE